MIFTNPDWPAYISGDKFTSSGLFGLVADSRSNYERPAVLKELAAGKRVIHFGFADHPPLIAEKIRSGVWLHNELTRVAAECVGLDINKQAIDFVASEFRIGNCFEFDLLSGAPLPIELSEKKWDVVVIGEVLEHVDNPVDFLIKIKTVFAPNTKQIVITVPNALSFENIMCSMKNIEYINTDHRYWFSPYTLVKVASRAGLRAQELRMCGPKRGLGMVGRLLTQRRPMLRETVVGVFDLR